MNGLIIDNFAGGGGASTGIEAALGRSVDLAVNHSAAAIAMHTANTALVGNIDAIDGGFDAAMLMRSKLPCGELERLENRKPYIVAVGQRIE